jgi:hypothetical protein
VPAVRKRQWPWLPRVNVRDEPQVPSGIPRLTADARAAQLDKDWASMSLNDLGSEAVLREVKQVLIKFYDLLCYVFAMYSVVGPRGESKAPAQYMSILSFIHLCKTCKVRIF